MHVNPNMIVPVLKGIARGEEMAGQPEGEFLMDAYERELIELNKTPVVGSYRAGNYVRAKQIAFAQGFIGAYRTAAAQHAASR